MNTERRPAVLLSAFATHPEMSSETGIGWQFLKATISATARSGEHIVALMNHRSSLVVTAELKRLELLDRVTVIGIDMPVGFRWLLRPQLTRLEYMVWNYLAQSAVRRLEEQYDFLLAHHVTFATEMFPTPITACHEHTYKVWGPIGSAGDPLVYRVPPVNRAARREELLQRLRDVLVSLPMRWVGAQVDLVLAQNALVARRFSAIKVAAEVFPNVIIKQELQKEIDSVPERTSRGFGENTERPLRILAVGHLVARKRFELGIYALTSSHLSDSSIHFLGRPLPGHPDALPAIADRLGVKERVHFMGKLPRKEVLQAMAEFDVLLHPSGREGASGVVGEATALGIPVVCFENTGASSVLDDAQVPGVRLDARATISADDLAVALRAAANMPRVRSKVWSERRFEDLQQRLLSESRARRLGSGSVQ